MFCCDNNKNKMACYEGMIEGGIIVAAFIFAINYISFSKNTVWATVPERCVSHTVWTEYLRYCG